jgi:hypothetical protein
MVIHKIIDMQRHNLMNLIETKFLRFDFFKFNKCMI